MNTFTAKTSPLPWWAAGIPLGLVQVLAISLVKPLDVSAQLSLSAVPFTMTMFGFGMLEAYLAYPKTPCGVIQGQ